MAPIARYDDIELIAIPTLKDNYTYILQSTRRAEVMVIDPGEAEPIASWVRQVGKPIVTIVCTHHHADHVGGVVELKNLFSSVVWTSARDRDRIAGADFALPLNQPWRHALVSFNVVAIPGHTAGHIALHQEEAQWLFCGDTLFGGGCGRLDEELATNPFLRASTLDEFSRLRRRRDSY